MAKSNKGGQKLGKKGSKARRIDKKADKSKEKTAKVNLPTEFVKKEEEEMSEHEISYRDKLLAVTMEKLAAKGFNNDRIIKELGISRSTFYLKLKTEPYFSYALYKHRGIAVAEVEDALFKRAKGYTYLEKTTEAKPVKSFDENGNQTTSYQLMTAKVVEKEIPGDVKAQEMFLVNRSPNEWKKKIEPMTEQGQDMSNITFTIKRRGN